MKKRIKKIIKKFFPDEPIALVPSWPVRNEPKVFEIGWPKTGTTSLAEAMRLLGYRSLHWLEGCTQKDKEDYLEKSIMGRVDFELMERNDFVGNLLFYVYFKVEKIYPNAKFILTVRDERAWFQSLAAHFNRTRYDLEALKKRKLTAEIFNRIQMFGALIISSEAEAFCMYRRHNQNVIDYFRDKPGKLLVTDVTQSGWEPLCQFLGKPIPDTPFPHLNSGKLQAEK